MYNQVTVTMWSVNSTIWKVITNSKNIYEQCVGCAYWMIISDATKSSNCNLVIFSLTESHPIYPQNVLTDLKIDLKFSDIISRDSLTIKNIWLALTLEILISFSCSKVIRDLFRNCVIEIISNEINTKNKFAMSAAKRYSLVSATTTEQEISYFPKLTVTHRSVSVKFGRSDKNARKPPWRSLSMAIN